MSGALDQSVQPGSYPVHAPEELGLNAALLEELVARARRDVVEGGIPSFQIAVARFGQLALFETVGDATPGSRYAIFSCTKPLVAAAIWQLLGEQSLSLEDRVAEHIPEFAMRGKSAVTVEHLLLHTAGFARAPLGPPEWLEREARVERMAQWRLDSEPGLRCEYHATSAHWVLAELIERLRGEDYREAVHRRVLDPMGLPGLRLGGSDSRDGVNEIRVVGTKPSPEEIEALIGTRLELPEISDRTLLRYNELETRMLGVPGAGAVGTAADVALFYQALLDDRKGLFESSVLADATSNIRVPGPDALTRMPANRSIGLVIKGNVPGGLGMGRTTSFATFGHPGVGGQIAWADPGTGISFCCLTNGLDAHPIRAGRRGMSFSNRAGACVSMP